MTRPQVARAYKSLWRMVPGAYAQYAVGPARAFVPKPSSLGFVPAAAIPLAGLTAWQSLVDTGHLAAGQKVLIHGAAGGVGHLAVQIAKARSAEVYGTGSAADHAYLAKLGVDHRIDYRTEDFRDTARGIDVALVPFPGQTRTRTLDSLRDGGTLITLLGGTPQTELEAARARGIRHRTLQVEYDQQGMRELAALAGDGRLIPNVAHVLPLDEAARAHRLGEAGHDPGKIVLAVS